MPRLPFRLSLLKRLGRRDAPRHERRRRRARGRLAVQTLDDRSMLSGLSPLAVNDSFTLEADTAFLIGGAGILANDSDPEGDTLSAVLFDGAANGTLNFNVDGSFNYSPNPGFIGYDSFSYLAFDGTSFSKLAAVTLKVVSPTQPPQLDLDADDSTALGSDFVGSFTEGDSPLVIVDSDATLNDPDSTHLASLTVAITNLQDGADETLSANTAGTNISAAYANGVLTLAGGDTLAAYRQVLGTIAYHNASQHPGATPRVITFVASDGVRESNVATSTVSVAGVNDAPQSNPDSFVTDEDTPLVVPAAGVLANDVDAEQDPISAVLVSGPSHGTVSLATDGSFVYTPNADYAGPDSFTYQATDGARLSIATTVSIAVTPINDAPLAVAESYLVTQGGALHVAASGVLGNDSDPDGDLLSAQLVSGPAHGTLALNADGSFSYTPNPGFTGADSFIYEAHDGAVASPATVSILVRPINAAPVLVNDAYDLDEDNVLTIAAPGLLANDSDADGDPLTVVLVTGPKHGMLTLHPDGSFSYTPDADYHGVDGFSYVAHDGKVNSDVAAVTLTIHAVNDAPLATDKNFSTDEDTPLLVAAAGVLAGDTDAEGGPLTAVLVTGPANGTLILNADGSYGYTPNPHFHGVDTFTYRASDGAAQSNLATVTIMVHPVNDAPRAVDDHFTINEDTALHATPIGVLINDVDVDGNPLTATLVSGPANGTIMLGADGSFLYMPNAQFHGIDSFTYRASDGAADSNLATVTITVAAVNDGPTAVNDVYATAAGTPLVISAAGVLANDSDIEGDSLSALLVSGPTNGTLALDSDGSFVYTPHAGFTGVDTFRYRAHDGAADSNEATVSITVISTQPEAAPEANSDQYLIAEDGVLIVPALGVLANDSDVNGDPLTAALVSGPVHGMLVLNADGSFTYTPIANFVGIDSFSYRASDGQLTSAPATVSIVVTEVNDAPTALNDVLPAVVRGSGPAMVSAATLVANDIPGPASEMGQALTVIAVGGAVHGSVALSAGTIVFTPEPGYQGPASFTYTIIDNGLTGGQPDPKQATGTVSIEVLPPVVTGGWQFDFNGPAGLTAPGYIPVGVVNDYSDIKQFYGWDNTASHFERLTQPDYKLLDGHYGKQNTFMLTGIPAGKYLVNVTLGDQHHPTDQVKIKVFGAVDPIHVMDAVPGQFASACVETVVDGNGRMFIQLTDVGGPDPYFRINTLEIWPLNSVSKITMERVGGQAVLPANGWSIDTFQGRGAPPNALITLTTTMGAFVTPDLPLSTSPYMGLQVMSDANGHFSFQLRRPSGVGAGFARITAAEVTARGIGAVVQNWQNAPPHSNIVGGPTPPPGFFAPTAAGALSTPRFSNANDVASNPASVASSSTLGSGPAAMIAGPTPIEPSAPQQAIAASAVASPAVGAKPLDLSYFLAEENLSARRKAKVSPINFSAESGQLAATDQIFGLGLWN